MGGVRSCNADHAKAKSEIEAGAQKHPLKHSLEKTLSNFQCSSTSSLHTHELMRSTGELVSAHHSGTSLGLRHTLCQQQALADTPCDARTAAGTDGCVGIETEKMLALHAITNNCFGTRHAKSLLQCCCILQKLTWRVAKSTDGRLLIRVQSSPGCMPARNI